MKEGVLLVDGTVAARIRKTSNAWERARGLLGRPAPSVGSGLLIDPCNGIHTCAMAYPIDAVFIDKQGRVLRVAANFLPWRFAHCPGARAVLEFASGQAARLGLREGVAVEWKELI